MGKGREGTVNRGLIGTIIGVLVIIILVIVILQLT
jgi:tetrahydromethanopterin S-methyltransferase subunit F